MEYQHGEERRFFSTVCEFNCPYSDISRENTMYLKKVSFKERMCCDSLKVRNITSLLLRISEQGISKDSFRESKNRRKP